MMYFDAVLGDTVDFDESEEVVAYATTYFKRLGKLLDDTDPRQEIFQFY